MVNLTKGLIVRFKPKPSPKTHAYMGRHPVFKSYVDFVEQDENTEGVLIVTCSKVWNHKKTTYCTLQTEKDNFQYISVGKRKIVQYWAEFDYNFIENSTYLLFVKKMKLYPAEILVLKTKKLRKK